VLLEARDAEIDLERKRSDKLAAELAELNAKKSDRGMVLTLGDVLFEFDKAQLLPGANRTIDQLAAFLSEHTDRSVLIEGHTDSIGSESYNIELSQRRAEAVRNALLSRQIPFYRIVSKGYGKSYPVAGNDSEAGRQQNRRVEIIILDAGVKAESMMR
jgi:outer membrane protein OmpA-like peptidoglycan-associated protein